MTVDKDFITREVRALTQQFFTAHPQWTPQMYDAACKDADRTKEQQDAADDLKGDYSTEVPYGDSQEEMEAWGDAVDIVMAELLAPSQPCARCGGTTHYHHGVCSLTWAEFVTPGDMPIFDAVRTGRRWCVRRMSDNRAIVMVMGLNKQRAMDFAKSWNTMIDGQRNLAEGRGFGDRR